MQDLNLGQTVHILDFILMEVLERGIKYRSNAGSGFSKELEMNMFVSIQVEMSASELIIQDLELTLIQN